MNSWEPRDKDVALVRRACEEMFAAILEGCDSAMQAHPEAGWQCYLLLKEGLGETTRALLRLLDQLEEAAREAQVGQN